jgi:hypothetical protein
MFMTGRMGSSDIPFGITAFIGHCERSDSGPPGYPLQQDGPTLRNRGIGMQAKIYQPRVKKMDHYRDLAGSANPAVRLRAAAWLERHTSTPLRYSPTPKR